MKVLNKLDSLDNINDGETRKLPTKTSQLTNDSGFIDKLVILSYGSSSWNDFITAYNKNKVVYCRASSNSNPASGSQTRLAFMAYVNNASSPTEVEFQYYRSVSSHSDSQQGDQVYVYKLTSAGSWTVTVRNAFSKVVAGTGLSSSYSNGAITLSANTQTETDPVFSASAAAGITSTNISTWNGKQDAISDLATIRSGAEAGATAVQPDDLDDYAPLASPALTGTPTAPTANAGTNTTQIATTAFVTNAISGITGAMVFKGTLGTSGTITSLPTNGTATVGDTYKVITDGTYASKAAKVGDIFICLTKTSSANTWELIPSGDDIGGTVTSVKINATSPIAIDNNAAITTSGERTISHANSGVTAGTYKSVTVDSKGHVTAGTNPTTLSGYGITDAKISKGTITLGSNTITPSTVQNIKDGSAAGSVRSSGSSTENENYTIGSYAFAEGYHTQASGYCSHAGGNNTKANKNYQTAIGKFNKNVSNALLEIGNGTADNARSNAFVVYSDGRAEIGADPTTAMGVATKQYVDNLILNAVYPVGSIYMSVNSTSPATLFGGTWEQITGDAYLKIVTENAGTLAGTSSKHKIPLTSIPAHHHSVPRVAQYGNSGATANFTSGNAWQGVSGVDTSNTGGGQAYYPYYYGVYVWRRTA